MLTMEAVMKIRCAIIGVGRIGSLLEKDKLREKPASHAGAISDNNETILVAGSDPLGKNLLEFGTDWKISKDHLYSNPAEMIQAETPDILHIATDTNQHIPLLKLAVDMKVPIVVLEKPVANSLKEANEGLSLLKGSKTRVIINHERRFSLDYNRVKEVIEQKTYGKLLSIKTRLFMGKTRRLSKVLYHDGTHLFDILRYLTGGEIHIDTISGDPETTNGNLVVVGTSDQDCAIICEFGTGRDHLVFELDCSFEKGRIIAGNDEYREFQSATSPFYEKFRSLSENKTIQFKETGYFRNMMAHAVELFKNKNLTSRSCIEDGIAAVKIIDSITAGFGE